jgi:hypothetical protein
MSIKYNLQVITGKFMKDGVEKNRYQTIGKILETKHGLQFKLDSLPICDTHWNGFGFCNEPLEKDGTYVIKEEDIKF